MRINVTENSSQLGMVAASTAAQMIWNAIEKKGQANIILATGISQMETLNNLVMEEIDWGKVTMFHLDEYIGLPESSPASFRRYLKERFIQKVPTLKKAHLVNGDANPEKECRRLDEIIKDITIDLALVGIGENGHLGFNDPPADFETEQPFIVVDLDEKCRKQQCGEGWFKTIRDVPRQAITMSIRQILKSEQIVCSVPGSRKAEAVRDCFEKPVSNLFPASILRTHGDCICFLDKSSSALLSKHGDFEFK
jgi:glucosamine-6-phosphate deaminase